MFSLLEKRAREIDVIVQSLSLSLFEGRIALTHIFTSINLVS